MNGNNHLEVIELIKIMNTGATEPILCKCNDGNLYVVKSTASVPRIQLIHELVAAKLAKSIGLPIPDFAIAYVSKDIIDFLPPNFKGKISNGYAFASFYIEESSPIKFNEAHSVIDRQKQKHIYFFDRIINNSDRCLSLLGGNVNIIYNHQKQSYYIIDHNLAFAPSCDANTFSEHVFSPKNRDWVYDMFDELTNMQIADTLNSQCATAIAELPEDWINDQAHVIENITALLCRGSEKDFRREIL